jgi:hypothetical protein
MGSFRHRRALADGTFPGQPLKNEVFAWLRLGSFRQHAKMERRDFEKPQAFSRRRLTPSPIDAQRPQAPPAKRHATSAKSSPLGARKDSSRLIDVRNRRSGSFGKCARPTRNHGPPSPRATPQRRPSYPFAKEPPRLSTASGPGRPPTSGRTTRLNMRINALNMRINPTRTVGSRPNLSGGNIAVVKEGGGRPRRQSIQRSTCMAG